MKGVILAGGSGTRLHPLTRITNKHLLPLYDRPMVTYAVEALVERRHRRADARHRRDSRRRVLPPARQRSRVRHRPARVRLPGSGRRDRRGARARRAFRRPRQGLRHARGQHLRALARAPSSRTSRARRSGARIVLSRVEEDEHLRHLGVAAMDGDRVTAHRREARVAAVALRRHRHLLLRRAGVGRDPDA